MSITTIKKDAHKEFDREFEHSRYARAWAKDFKAFLDKQMDIAYKAASFEIAETLRKYSMDENRDKKSRYYCSLVRDWIVDISKKKKKLKIPPQGRE